MATRKWQTGSGAEQTGFFNHLAWLRLALLIAPCASVVWALGSHPIYGVVTCLLLLSVWLVVDVWPFRPTRKSGERAKRRMLPH